MPRMREQPCRAPFAAGNAREQPPAGSNRGLLEFGGKTYFGAPGLRAWIHS